LEQAKTADSETNSEAAGGPRGLPVSPAVAKAALYLGALGIAAFALWVRLSWAGSNLQFDTIHFVRFSGVLFGRGHLDYYVWNQGAPDLYRHLPGFPYLLYPFLRIVRALHSPDIYAIKFLIYAADFGSAAVLFALGRRNGLGSAGGLAVAAMWLFAAWVFQEQLEPFLETALRALAAG